jgi:hypothetical protein
MKYFNNLPKREYTTTIGSFNIVDMTSYYDVNALGMQTTETDVDNTLTLIEFANTLYNDIDSFWLFLFANDSINPFTLLEQSNTDLKNFNESLTGVQLLIENQQADGLFTTGSLLLPSTSNTGSAWSFGSTGNFSLTGGFALIDSYNPFSKRAVIKYTEGFSLGLSTVTGITFSGLIKGKTAYTTYDQPTGIYGVDAELNVAEEINYLTSDSQTYVSVKSEYPLLKKGSGQSPYEPLASGGVTLDFKNAIQKRIPRIKTYLPGTVKQSNFIKIVQNYEDI